MNKKKGYQKRDDKRRTSSYFNNFISTKVISYKLNEGKNINYIMIKNLYNLFFFHFNNNKTKIDLIDETNYKKSSNENFTFTDFRDGSHFKLNFCDEIEKGKKLILFNLFMDGTNIHGKKKKSIVNVYLEFVNDYLNLQKNEKYIYNIASITKENLKLCFEPFLDHIFSKFKEIEKIIFDNEIIHTYLFNFIGDNQQIYEVFFFIYFLFIF
jgi:hypothetical protein